MGEGPEISVVVPSRDRPVRLRWLLNALEDQTLARDRWEILVGHDSSGPETEELLRTHPLARAGNLRHVTLAPRSGGAGSKRNAALRLARAEVVVFTDDDCYPPPEWLERVRAAARRHPGAVIQGATRPDSEEGAMVRAPHHHTQNITPPGPWAEACNIVYPRELIERIGGFEEDVLVAEDTDLAVRARQAGAAYVPAGEMITYHAIQEESLTGQLRGVWRWRDLPWLLKRYPSSRREFTRLWIFWKPRHVWFPLALAGLVLARRRASFALLAAPWVVHALPNYGVDPRGRLRSFSELPLVAAVDAAEFAALAHGSVRYRTLLI